MTISLNDSIEKYLHQKTLERFTLGGKKFQNETVTETILDEALVGEVEFVNCVFESVGFYASFFYFPTFKNCIFSNVNFKNSEFLSGEFVNCEFKNCNLVSASFQEIVFDTCKFQTNNLTFASFSETQFINLRLQNNNLRGIYGTVVEFYQNKEEMDHSNSKKLFNYEFLVTFVKLNQQDSLD